MFSISSWFSWSYKMNKKTHWKTNSWDSRTKFGRKGNNRTSFLFSSRSSSFSLALFPATLFLSASYCLCVLSWLMLRFRATFTRAVISFIAAVETRNMTKHNYANISLYCMYNLKVKVEGLTCQRAGVSEGSDLWVWESSEQRNDRVHHVFIVDDAVLALTDQDADELTEVVAKLLPQRTRNGQGVIATVLH